MLRPFLTFAACPNPFSQARSTKTRFHRTALVCRVASSLIVERIITFACALLLVSFLPVTSNRAVSDEPKPRISTLLEKVIESRREIKTYAVSVDSIRIDRTQSLTKETDANQRIIHSSLQVLCDSISDRTLIIDRPHALHTSHGFAGKSIYSAPRVFLISGQEVKQLLLGKFFPMSGHAELNVPDPLSLGMGLCGQWTRYYPANEVMAGLLTWESDRNYVTRQGPRTIFNSHQDLQSDNASIVQFDTSRGNMVVHIQIRGVGGTPVGAQARTVPIQVDHHWVPSRVLYNCENDTAMYYEFDWISINQPIPDDLFDEEVLLTLFGDAK